MFSAVNVARKCEVEPSIPLTNACNRFIIYFTAVEKYTQEKQLCWSDLTPQELNSLAAGDNRTILTMRFIKISGVKTMNKTELVAAVAEKAEISKKTQTAQ